VLHKEEEVFIIHIQRHNNVEIISCGRLLEKPYP